jgi:hypothetical protein
MYSGQILSDILYVKWGFFRDILYVQSVVVDGYTV